MGLSCMSLIVRLGIVCSVITLCIPSTASLAQPIVADPAWGDEATLVNLVDVNRYEIEGGAIRENNQFHSFLEFNVSDTGSAYFVTSPEISDIFSRIIGGAPSNIQGTVGVLGDANLFLMNPNGVIFGSGGRLDVQGAFVTTTADAIEFESQGEFDTVSLQPPGVLTVTPSAFLFNQINPAPILNQSIASNLDESTFTDGLRVADGHSLLLVGGDVSSLQGQLRAPGGTIEIAGLSALVPSNGDSLSPVG